MKPAPIGAGDVIRQRLRRAGLVTVCEEARCPNLADCFTHGTATFMILGGTCTRACAFCAVETGTPAPPDPDEPERLARTAAAMDLRHVVVTSVDRDDLADGGAGQFVRTIRALREVCPHATVEVLVPDFGGRLPLADPVIHAAPEVWNHNLETVPRLYDQVRPGAEYNASLALIRRAKEAGLLTKSGLMAGLGETDEELINVFADLKQAGCDVLTVGQYLQPTRAHRQVSRYLPPDGFRSLRERARAMGFAHVAAGPLVRSSFNAGGVLKTLRAGRGA